MNGAPSAMVSPGLWGFVAFFVLALALYLLMRNMNARMQRMSYRSEERTRAAQAEADERRSRKDRDGTKADGDRGDSTEGDAPEDPEQTGGTNH